MRIVAGSYGGRLLRSPENDAARPTLDRVREALFSSLYSLRGELDGAYVLDAFAGSGALGLEALSRGAAQVTFCEKDPAAQRVIRANVEALGVADQVQLCWSDVLRTPPSAPAHPFDLVLLDPPYATGVPEVATLLQRLHDSGALAPDALISYEHAAPQVDEICAFASDENSPFDIIAEKKYGKTHITLLRQRP